MAKSKTSFSLSADSIDLLKQLAKLNRRSQAGMLEVLIDQSAKKAKIESKVKA